MGYRYSWVKTSSVINGGIQHTIQHDGNHGDLSVTLIREINLISRNQFSLAKSTYKIDILWQMYIVIALFSSKKVNGLMGGTLSQNNKFKIDFEYCNQHKKLNSRNRSSGEMNFHCRNQVIKFASFLYS